MARRFCTFKIPSQGSLSVNEAESLLSQDSKFRDYFETTLFALSAIGGQDTYMNKIKGV
jgi:hypothetical protein